VPLVPRVVLPIAIGTLLATSHACHVGLFNKLKHFDKPDSFMSMRVPDLAFGRLYYTDAWNLLEISILHKNGAAEYNLQFFEFFGQPVNRLLTNYDHEQNLNQGAIF
jgi:hypothetical protein